MRRIVAVLLALLPMAAPITAVAQLPAVDPAGQYRLIGPAERSDSRCIGRPDTPLCAVETLLACFARRDPALCRVVWPQAASLDFAGASHIRYWWSYRVAAAEQAAPDEAVIAIAGRNCGLQMAEPDCATTPAPPTRYRVQRRDNAWQVVEWSSSPGVKETSPN